MGRTRIISANKAVYASATGLLVDFYGYPMVGATGIKPVQLHRIDSLSFDIDLASARTDVREFGQLARIASLQTSDIVPTVSLGYYLTDGENEMHLGLNVEGINNAGGVESQFISGIMSENRSYRARNLYVMVAPEGQDAFNPAAGTHNNNNDIDVIAFGNCFLSNYSVDFSVGEIPRADVELIGSNVHFITGRNSGNGSVKTSNPALNVGSTGAVDTGMWALIPPDTGNSAVDILRPGDVTVTFSDSANGLNIGGVSLPSICIQSLTIDVPLSRTPIQCLGKTTADSQALDFPIDVTMGVSANVKDFQSGSLQQVLTNAIDGQKQDITVKVKNRSNTTQTALQFVLKNAVLDSQNFSLGLDDNETVDLQFSTQIAGALNTGAGLFVSGQYKQNSSAVGTRVTNPLTYQIQ